MPVYVDSQGNRYWIDGDPVPGIHRDDLVQEQEPSPIVAPDTDTGE